MTLLEKAEYKNAVKYVNSQLVYAEQAIIKKDEIKPLLNAIKVSVKIMEMAIADGMSLEVKKYANNIKHCAMRIKDILHEEEEV